MVDVVTPGNEDKKDDKGETLPRGKYPVVMERTQLNAVMGFP